MSTAVFPTLKGLGWNVKRTPMWSTNRQQNVSGKEVGIALWSNPRWRWQMNYAYLRSDLTNAELQSLLGFFNQRQGMFDSFLYADAEDNAVTAQVIGTGDGAKQIFQLVRTYGGATENIIAPNVVSNVYLNGVNQPSGWTVGAWGSVNAGLLTFSTPPGAGVVITITYSYYWPCRFEADSMDFTNFLYRLWSLDGVSIISLK